jgi:hypothetical protein
MQLFAILSGYSYLSSVVLRTDYLTYPPVRPSLDLIAVAVHVAPLRPVAVDIDIDMDLDDFVRSEEAVLDPLPQRVGISRRPEIMNVGDVLGFLGRGRQSDLGSAGEVVEGVLPGCVVSGAATMALIDDNQVKKARREFPVKLLGSSGPVIAW